MAPYIQFVSTKTLMGKLQNLKRHLNFYKGFFDCFVVREGGRGIPQKMYFNDKIFQLSFSHHINTYSEKSYSKEC